MLSSFALVIFCVEYCIPFEKDYDVGTKFKNISDVDHLASYVFLRFILGEICQQLNRDESELNPYIKMS